MGRRATKRSLNDSPPMILFNDSTNSCLSISPVMNATLVQPAYFSNVAGWGSTHPPMDTSSPARIVFASAMVGSAGEVFIAIRQVYPRRGENFSAFRFRCPRDEADRTDSATE